MVGSLHGAFVADKIGDVHLSSQSKATFETHSRKDEATGESYMTEEDFVDAIAPIGEDYVSLWLLFPVPEMAG